VSGCLGIGSNSQKEMRGHLGVRSNNHKRWVTFGLWPK
jgi:hypothetical protein